VSSERSETRERALVATGEELAGLVHHPSADVLLALLDNPALDETHVCLLLERKDFGERYSKSWRGAKRS